MPRTMMSMASVTMKALRRRRTTIKPLMKPMRPPTSSTTRMPTKVGSSKPKPKLAAGTTTMAPIAGANPYTDSSDRSNLPVMMTSDSASTTRASAADEVRMVLILPEVRKTGLTIVPIMTSRASAGSSARSRRRATTILVAVGAIRAVPHDQNAVACPEIFQLAADHQDRFALPPHVLDDLKQRFLRLHVDARGRVHQDQD